VTAGGVNTGDRRVLLEARTDTVVVLALDSGGGYRGDALPREMENPHVCGGSPNGASRARTGDLLHAMQALSQLSYSPTPVRRPL
jgi:hypothetical protein